MKETKIKLPSMLDALIPIVFLVSLLSLAVYLFGDEASWGPNQIALTFSSLTATVIALTNGDSWKDLGDGVMEEDGLLKRLVQSLLKMAHSTGSLIATTVFTCVGTNVITSDQYMSIVLPGKMYKLEYEKRNLAPENLSRTLKDSGTITSPLIQWNTCGAYMAGTLGVATFTYLPFTFLISSIRSLLLFMGI